MKKHLYNKIISLILSAIILCTFIPAAAIAEGTEGTEGKETLTLPVSGKCNDNIDWTLSEDGVLTLTGSGKMNDYAAEEDVPWYDYRDLVKTLNIDNAIENIADYAFSNCQYLTEIQGAENVRSIGTHAFYSCHELKSIDLSGVDTIRTSAFSHCNKLGNVTFSDTITEIGAGAFRFCSSFTEVIIPENVISIGGHAFQSCKNLVKVVVPASVQSLSTRAKTESYIMIADAFGGNRLRSAGPIGSGCDYEFGWTESIPDYAFSGCHAMENVYLPESIKKIGDYAFEECWNMDEIDLPEGLTEIGKGAFSICSKLDSIKIPMGVTVINDETFEECQALKDTGLREGITSIGSHAYYDCDSLTSVVIPESTTSVGEFAFSMCDNIEKAIIPESTKTFGISVWHFCTKLRTAGPIGGGYDIEFGWKDEIPANAFCAAFLSSVEIPDGIKVIGDYAFKSDGNIKEYVIPGSVDTIGMFAFGDWQSLEAHMYFLGDKPENIHSRSFDYVKATAYYYCDTQGWEYIDLSDTRYGAHDLKWVAIHDEVTDAGKEPTCTAEGLSEGKHCVTCGKVLVAQETIPKTEHTAAVDERVEPTCKKTGLTEGSHCADCGEVLVAQESIPATGEHVEATRPGYEPDCDTPGYTESIYCVNCGNIFGRAEIEPLGHDYVEVPEIPPTKTSIGRTAGIYCARCGYVKEGLETIPVGVPLKLSSDKPDGSVESVWIDGVEYTGKVKNGVYSIVLPHENFNTAVTYSYNKSTAARVDVHTVYPKGMKVWMLTYDKTAEAYKMTYVKELDNILQYAGSSIRITGNKGIRMITGVPESVRKTLIEKGINGYKLQEYGTLVAWESELEGSLTVDSPNRKMAYAYKRDVADPVYKRTNGTVQYTNVLVGFSNDQCKNDLVMRPYMMLRNSAGKTIYIYGGEIHRSIGYIAYQNRNAFAPGTASYDYIWGIIHHVYGKQYDADYKG